MIKKKYTTYKKYLLQWVHHIWSTYPYFLRLAWRRQRIDRWTESASNQCLRPALSLSSLASSVFRERHFLTHRPEKPFSLLWPPKQPQNAEEFSVRKKGIFIINLILGKVSCSLFPPLASKTTSKCTRVFCQKKGISIYYFDIRQSQLLFRPNYD